MRHSYRLVNVRAVLTHGEYDRGDRKEQAVPTVKDRRRKLPGRFEDLVRMMPPQAIMDELQ